MPGIIATYKDVSKNWDVYDKYAENLYIKNKKKKQLIENNPEYKTRVENTKDKANSIMNAIKVIDNHSENYAENIEIAGKTVVETIAFLSMLPFMALMMKNSNNKSKMLLYTILSTIPVFIITIITEPILAKMQIIASRLGRNKAIKEKLNDINYFVEYTPEQIKKAEEIVDNNNLKTKNRKNEKFKDDSKQTFKESINEIVGFRKNYKEFKAEKEQELGINKHFQEKLNKNYTIDEIQNANQDKELILHASRIINNTAEDYSENTENAFNTLNKLEALIMFPVILLVNKIVGALSSKQNVSKNKTLSSIISMYSMLALMMIGTSAQKDAARVGRYKAHQNLKNDISPIVYFDDKELNSAGDVDNDYKKVGGFKKIINNLKFIKTYFKDNKEYKNYIKNEAKKEKQKLEELRKIEKTPEQLKKATELQEKTFFAFKEIDEMSQSYSENMEVLTNYANLLISLPITFVVEILPAIIIMKAFNGNLNTPKYAKTLSKLILDKNSNIRLALEQLQEVNKTDKSIRKLINNAFVSKDAAKKLLNNEKTKEPIEKLLKHLNEILPKLDNDIEGVIRNEVKKNKFSNYLINLGKDIINIIIKRKEKTIFKTIEKAKNSGKEYTPNANEKIILNIRNQLKQNSKIGKTLTNSLIIGSIPILGVIFLVPFAVQSIFTNIQKKSGRIGVMKATNTLDKAEYFT